MGIKHKSRIILSIAFITLCADKSATAANNHDHTTKLYRQHTNVSSKQGHIAHRKRCGKTPKIYKNSAELKNLNETQNKQVFRTGYIEFIGGVSVPKGYLNKEALPSKYKQSPLGGIAFGFKLSNHFYTDLSVMYRGKYKWSHFNDDPKAEGIDRNKIDNLSFLLNTRFILDENKCLKPYFLVGAGVAINKASDIISGKEKSSTNGIKYHERKFGKTIKSFTWQVGIGTFLEITQDIQLDLSYRFANLGKYQTSDVLTRGEVSLPFLGDGQKYSVHKPIKGRQKTHEFVAGFLFRL